MAVETSPRGFSFSFSDLAARDSAGLSLVEPEALPVAPAETRLLEAGHRPRWLPPLLPIFRAGDPLRVAVRAAAAPAFAARLLDSLAHLFAIAGADSGTRVGIWEGGFGVGSHGLARLAAEPHVQLVAAELEPVSMRTAVSALDELPASARWLVLHGNLPAIDSLLGIERALARVPAERVVRLPLFEREDLAATARGVAAGLGRQRMGAAFLDLAVRLARAYLEAQP